MFLCVKVMRIFGLCSALLLLAGCAPSFYMIKSPTPSGIGYASLGEASSDQIVVLDERKANDRTFSSGVLPATLRISKDPIDPPNFLAKSLEEEFRSRGIATSVSTSGSALPIIHLRTFRVQNHRASGFSPFFTFTYLSADLETDSGLKRIGVYVRRGKVPVWSFNEVIDPTFQQPLSIAIKEFASKIAAAMYGYKVDDATVKRLQEKISAPRTDQSYLDVYSLGFTNNALAIPTLVELTRDADEYVRQTAISSLGTLKAIGQFELLKNIYSKADASRQDRDMAAKAIADLGTKESAEFVIAELKRLSTLTDQDSIWTTRVLSLYY